MVDVQKRRLRDEGSKKKGVKHNYVECVQKKSDCFCFFHGFCRLLVETDFGKRTCPFYKTGAQAEEDARKRLERLGLKKN